MDIGASRKNAASLLKAGRVDEAATVLRRAGLVLEAADVLAEQGNYTGAADALIGEEGLDALDRRLLSRAAAYLERAGRFEEAARACVALGDPSRAAGLMERVSSVPPTSGRTSGIHGERPSSAYVRTAANSSDRYSSQGAPRGSTPSGARLSVAPPTTSQGHALPADQLARQLEAAGRHEDAAHLYLEAGALGSAVRAFLAAGNKARALKVLTRVPRDNPRYRQTCILAIELAEAIDEVDFDFDQYVGRFLEKAPADDAECAAFLRAAKLFERHGFAENASEVAARLVATHPSYPGARLLSDSLEQNVRASKGSLEKIAREDHAFRQRSSDKRPAAKSGDGNGKDETFPSLPEMPAPRSRRDPPAKSLAPQAASSSGETAAVRTVQRIDNVHSLQPGLIVGDRYRLEKKLGSGGMAAVYAAKDLELGEVVALKLFARSGNDPSLLLRFRQELALARQISHPNVVRLYDIGSHDDIRFISMEMLSGKDLADKLDESRELVRDLGYLIQVCEGMNCVHERGVVHRDLKPENLFVTNEGVVKLMDFGIAKRQAGQGNLTVEGFTAGTPAYMAPEQINDFTNATHLSDIYSIGVIAYRMFAGVLPFDHDNAMAVLMKHLHDAPTPPSTWDPTIPDDLEFLILQLLEKEPRQRIQSCREIASQLKSLHDNLLSAKRRR
jgi:tetratricopeptide (TPR) repeat protein